MGSDHDDKPVGNERPRGRLARLFEAADRRHVPLRTILVTVGVVVATYLAGKLLYLLRDIVVLMLVAGFTAVLLNPVVAIVQRRIPRRGLAVTIVTLLAALVFIGLAAAFGVPLVNGSPTWRTGCPATSPARSTAGAGSATSWPGTTSGAGCSGTRPSWPATPSRSASRP